MNTDIIINNETITLAMIVGYCLSALNDISEHLGNNDSGKAGTKVYEALRFIKDKTSGYSQTPILIDGAENNE